MILLRARWKWVQKTAKMILYIFVALIFFQKLAGPPIELLLQSPLSPVLARTVGDMIGASLMVLLYAGYKCFPAFEERMPRVASWINRIFWLGLFVGFAGSQYLLKDLQIAQYGIVLRLISLLLMVVAATIPVIRHSQLASQSRN